jgi:hypothetical protein
MHFPLIILALIEVVYVQRALGADHGEHGYCLSLFAAWLNIASFDLSGHQSVLRLDESE